MPEINDKELAIIALTLIAIVAMWVMGAGAKDIVSTVIGAIGGFTVGQSMRR